MERDKEFRRVNPILDARPRFGPIPADLILPWAGITVVFYLIFQGILQLGYLWTILLIAWGCGTWWILTGSKPHQFLSKFIREPHWCRGYVRYQTISQAEQGQQLRRTSKRSKKRSRKKRKHHETRTQITDDHGSRWRPTTSIEGDRK